jgi:hypothetical protein
LPYQSYVTEEQGLEPRPAEPESAVLPLDDSPKLGGILAFSTGISKFTLSIIGSYNKMSRYCRVVQFHLFKEKIDRIYKINRIKINRNLVNPVNPVQKRVD